MSSLLTDLGRRVERADALEDRVSVVAQLRDAKGWVGDLQRAREAGEAAEESAVLRDGAATEGDAASKSLPEKMLCPRCL